MQENVEGQERDVSWKADQKRLLPCLRKKNRVRKSKGDKQMKTEILKRYREICEVNDDMIKKVDEIAPMCFLIKRDYNIIPIVFKFENREEKIRLKNALKNFILKQDIWGYILILDVKVTMVDKKGKKPPKVTDAVLRNLYTPSEKKIEMVTYKDKKILNIKRLTKKEARDTKDEWDLWGKGVDTESVEDMGFDYGEFKAKNPELYDRVFEQFDDYEQFRDKNGNIIIAYKIDHKEKAFKYYMPDDTTESEKEKLNEALNQIKELNRNTVNYKIIREVKK